jgi:hypothetical protein
MIFHHVSQKWLILSHKIQNVKYFLLPFVNVVGNFKGQGPSCPSNAKFVIFRYDFLRICRRIGSEICVTRSIIIRNICHFFLVMFLLKLFF